jgi:hypothetical protein
MMRVACACVRTIGAGTGRIIIIVSAITRTIDHATRTSYSNENPYSNHLQRCCIRHSYFH